MSGAGTPSSLASLLRNVCSPAWKAPSTRTKFTQASYDTVLKFGGSGLGLTITRRLLALYGSQVHIDSEPARGSTFSFNLRLAVPAAGSPVSS